MTDLFADHIRSQFTTAVNGDLRFKMIVLKIQYNMRCI